MRLHLFNPEHDIALSHNTARFTAPRAGRVLRANLDFLPLLWADDDDVVLVAEDAAVAPNEKSGNSNYSTNLTPFFRGRRVTASMLRDLPITEVCPWGWDEAICHELLQWGVSADVLPTHTQLQVIRQLSSRQFAASILRELVAETDELVGEAEVMMTLPEHFLPPANSQAEVSGNPTEVWKAPWSSSGRGVRFISQRPTAEQMGWARNVLERQGCLTREPYYNNIMDFGMEFLADEKEISYRGLSLFDTTNGAYCGNLLATEEEKRSRLEAFISLELVDRVQQSIRKHLWPHLRKNYKGPFGVDMMIVGTSTGSRLHPMVEINLRHTMGHVAISLAERGARGSMKIEYQNRHYQFMLKTEK